MSPEQQHPFPDPEYTSSKTGTFYFAFGSNLSALQMSLRLSHSPESSVPVAIGRLERHSWIICERGYANVVALPSKQSDTAALGDDEIVWGVLYNMQPEDEARLDMYEGHNAYRNPEPTPTKDPQAHKIKKYEQDGWDYNKHYLPIVVTKWMRDPPEYGISGAPSDWKNATTVRALVYVDEYRTQPGKIVSEYIGRMNRAIKESVEMGLPQEWVDKVMRKFIPEGEFPKEHGYVGTDEGYVEEADAEETEEQAKATETTDRATNDAVAKMVDEEKRELN